MRRAWSCALAVGLVVAPAVTSCTGSDDGGDGGGGSTATFCSDMREFETLQAEGDALFEEDEVPIDRLRDVFTRFSAAIDRLEASAPEEVDADVQLVGETTQQLIEAYERAEFDFVRLATDPEYAEVLAGLDEVRVTEANDRLAVFVRERC